MNKNKDDFIQFFHACHPTSERNLSFKALLGRWKEQAKMLEKHFENRDAEQAFDPMCKGILTFFYALYIANDASIESIDIYNWRVAVRDFDVRPLNMIDRLAFIIEHPAKYHSFIQLKELFKELNKKYAAHNIKVKNES